MKMTSLIDLSAILLVLLLSASVPSSAFPASGSKDKDNANADANKPSCRLWYAPSHITTTRDKPKYGLFAGIAFAENETIHPHPDIAIPLVDLTSSNYRGQPVYKLHKEILDYLESIVWLSWYAGAHYYGDYASTLFVPGAGALANYHSGIHNIDWEQGDVLCREHEHLVEPGKYSPGRGAYTDIFNMTMRATRDIPAGMELFANFGDMWDKDKDEDKFQDRLTRQDYNHADDYLEKLLVFMDKYKEEMDGPLEEEVLDFILETVLDGVGEKRAKVVRSLLPPRLSKLKQVKEVNGTFMYRNQDLIRSAKWLEEHGICVDNLYADKSTIPDAGRGAFASRKIHVNETIAPVPLVPIISDKIMDMYHFYQEADKANDVIHVMYDASKPRGKQLLLNYAYGHRESSMLFVPSSPMVNLVNHGTTPNARLLWSEHPHVTNDHEVGDVTIGDWDMSYDPQVIMLLVAIRDIEEGEEILIDYGSGWQSAWDLHVKQFGFLHSDGTWPLKAEDVQLEYKDKPYPVDLKSAEVPYPEGVATACFLQTDDPPDGTVMYNEKGQ